MRGAFVATGLVLIAAAALAGESAPGPVAGAKKDADAGPGYRERSLAAKDGRDRLALGLWCRERGLVGEAASEFRAALRLDPGIDAAHEALGDQKVDGRWVPSPEAMRAKGLVLHEGRWVLPEERDALKEPRDEKARRVREEDRARRLIETLAGADERGARLAREALSGIEDRCKLSPLAFALRARDPAVRLHAAAELGRIKDRRSLRPLVFRALRDTDARVRAACVDAAKAFADPEVLAPFFDALLRNPNPEVRAAAADGIGRLGDPRGVEVLIWRIEGHGGGLGRAYIYTANQLSFIQDFDVEVAQTAFIADPIVGILQEGAVLDVKLVSSEWHATLVERRAIGGALHALTGADHGEDAAAWRRWQKESRETAAAKAR